MGVFIMAKKIIFYVFLVLLLDSSYCTPADDLSDTFENGNENKLDSEVADDDTKFNEDTENGFQDTEIDAAKEQALQLNIGKKLTLTIATEGSGGGGVTYTRWGHKKCRDGAELVYSGYAGGSEHQEYGGGANLLCMPTTGVGHLSHVNPGHYSFVYGSEYESQNKIWRNHDWNVPCAVCYVPDKSTKLQVPGMTSCPSSWTQEYKGYLMTDRAAHRRNAVYECIDEAGQTIPGSQRSTNGALLYFVVPRCGKGMPCGPYNGNIAITCSICTR